jgi:hypothetical protein
VFNPQAYIPGVPPSRNEPLGRYLPPVPGGIASTWLSNYLSPLSTQLERTWVLDPFCAAPRLAIEAASAGYKVVVSANNPIARFLLEMAASPPSEAEMHASLAELASIKKGDERLEPHIRSLYNTTCARCEKEVMADAFLWDRDANLPFARIYQCPYCGDSGEYPTTPSDIARASQFSKTGLHYARALERVTAIDDPDRHHVEEALTVYLPRALYAIFSIINKLDGLSLPQARRNHLLALCLTACDLANTLWPYPTERARPRQLTIPPRFRENNVWLALEQGVFQWASQTSPIPLTYWPEMPPSEGGIGVFEGRLKDLVLSLPETRIGAVLAPLPRPNQAFWSLSALWAGWLWGHEAVGPFKSVLRRRRYDWTWHCIALSSALESLAPHLVSGTPMFGTIGENEPGFLSAALLAANSAGFRMKNLAIQSESGQAQIVWERAAPAQQMTTQTNRERADLIRVAAQNHLRQRGEPTVYLNIHSAGLEALIHSKGMSSSTLDPAGLMGEVSTSLEEAFSYRGGFLRIGGSEKSLDVGQWWLREAGDVSLPLADRVEKELVRLLIERPQSTLLEIDQELCNIFSGLLTPSAELIEICLESYAEQNPPGSGQWQLREQDAPQARRVDLMEIQKLLSRMAVQMGYSQQGERPTSWHDQNGALRYVFYVIASAIISDEMFEREYPPELCLFVIPGGRANLVAYKIHRDPRLRLAVETGWRFVKYRQLRRLAESPLLIRETLDDHFSQDGLTLDAPQLHLF